MRKILVATTLLALIAGPVAIAQTGSRSASPSSEKQGPWPAPVGHRQPRTADIPTSTSGSRLLDQEDARVDRSIRSVCRGC